MKKTVSLLLIITFLFLFTSVVPATSIDKSKQELNKVGQNIKDAENDLKKVNQEQSKVSTQLQTIDQDLAKKEKELREAEAYQIKTQKELEATRLELSEVEQTLETTQIALEETRVELSLAIEATLLQEDQMADRLRAMYMTSTASYLELILESKSINELFSKVEMITQLVVYDQQVFVDMTLHREAVDAQKAVQEEQEKIISQARDEVEGKKIALEQQEQAIRATKEKITNQKKEIESRQKDRKKLLTQLETEKATISKDLDDLEKLSKQLEKKIQDLIKEQEAKRKQTLTYAGGALAWPVPGFEGKITSPFGMRIHPILKNYRMHTGIDIAGSGINNKPAVAAADGVVIMATWYGGYGNTVIVDHGSGITTLYAHGSQISVKAGATVKRGQTVLRVGSTGNSTGPHLHFEVRKNGSPVDPLPYLRK